MRRTVLISFCSIILFSAALFSMEWFSNRPIGETIEKASIDVSDIVKTYKITDQDEIDVLNAIENKNMVKVKKYLNDQDFLNRTSDNFFDAAAAVATAIHDTNLAGILQNYKYLRDYSNMLP